MALSTPLDLLSDFPGWSTGFDLLLRQEYSRQAGGQTRSKDLGPPLWQASYVSKTLKPNTLDYWRGRLDAAVLDQMPFAAWPLARTRPGRHPGNGALPTGAVQSIGSNRKSLRVDGLPEISLSVGDFIGIAGGLYRLSEPALAVDGLTPLFEVRPWLWPEAVVGASVTIYRPSCAMLIVPGSVSSDADPKTGRGSISWQAVEARS